MTSWPGFVPAIHVLFSDATIKTWIPGTSPGTTKYKKAPENRGL